MEPDQLAAVFAALDVIMRDEGVPDETRRRIRSRVLYGTPDGPVEEPIPTAADPRPAVLALVPPVNSRPRGITDPVKVMAAQVGNMVDGDELTLALLEQLAIMWTTEAETRRRSAERASLFGPKMMILAAEGSVLLACASQLRQVVKIIGQMPAEPTPASTTVTIPVNDERPGPEAGSYPAG